jgi:PhoPQ-activated pathogenicity-related protein
MKRTLCIALTAGLMAAGSAVAGALEDYVKRPDPAYAWSVYERSSGFYAKYFFIRLQSQQWLDAQQVDRPLWEHEMRIAQPRPFFCGETARTSTVAILIISGGSNKPELTREVPPHAGVLANTFCRPVIELRQVPNEPLLFSGEPGARKEDGIIAYSFDRYLRGDQGDWPVQLAMVRAVVQAMTAVQEFSRTRKDVPDIEQFVLLGASKRGWTAWLTAAVDPRVRAIVPVSIDMPSMVQQFPHHFASYGEYAPALKDYEAFDIGCRMAGPRGAELLNIVDPIAYLDKLTQPKLILNSAGDEFFVSDSWRFYYDRLLGHKRLRYTVNSDHRQGGAQARMGLYTQARNWINDILEGREPPKLEWQRRAGDTLVVQAAPRPREVRLWTAENAQARDFRLETLGPAWESQPLRADPDGAYRVKLAPSPVGWRAYVAEAVFGGDRENEQQIYTTGVYVTPDTLPHPPHPPNRCEPPKQADSGSGAPAAATPNAR